MKTLQNISVTILFILLVGKISSQELGAELGVNPQTESFGLGLRAQIPISFFAVSPQFMYYPFINKVSEWYLGASLHIPAVVTSKFILYGIGNAAYNSWMNFYDSPLDNPKPTNFVFEAGGGISGRSCVKPFAEYRYNIHWKETNARVGVVIDLACYGKTPGVHQQSVNRRAVNCPGH